MLDLYFKGGVLFMTLLTAILVVMLVLSIMLVQSIFIGKIQNSYKILKQIKLIRSLGTLALMMGLLGQLVGLFSAFSAIKIGQVEATPSLFFEGFKVSMISSIYGILIFGLSMCIGYGLKKGVGSI
jgi:hypothetical protein